MTSRHVREPNAALGLPDVFSANRLLYAAATKALVVHGSISTSTGPPVERLFWRSAISSRYEPVEATGSSSPSSSSLSQEDPVVSGEWLFFLEFTLRPFADGDG